MAHPFRAFTRVAQARESVIAAHNQNVTNVVAMLRAHRPDLLDLVPEGTTPYRLTSDLETGMHRIDVRINGAWVHAGTVNTNPSSPHCGRWRNPE